MIHYQQYNRRKFLSNLSLAAGAIGLGMSHIVKAESNFPDPSATTVIDSELSSLMRANGWLNTGRLSTSELKNKVVVINFWTYTCINWLRQLPYVREWSKKYKDAGLIVIGVHTPEFTFEQDFSNVRRAATNLKVGYPVAIDNDRLIWDAFNNNYWPALYILDTKGKIRHQQFGEGGYEDCERVIQQLLSESGGVNLNHGLVSTVGKDLEAPADWSNLVSLENYLGQTRTKNFISAGNSTPDNRKKYSLPIQLKLNQWALSGDWRFKEENIVSQKAGGRIAYQFHARDLHLVMGPSMNGKPVRFRISIDGESPRYDHGKDVDDNGYGIVIEQRLYQLIRQEKIITSRRFEIEFVDPGIEAFAFTFG